MFSDFCINMRFRLQRYKQNVGYNAYIYKFNIFLGLEYVISSFKNKLYGGVKH